MALLLDRRAIADIVRASPGFRSLTKDIERKTVRTAVHVADSKVHRQTGAYVENFETAVRPLVGALNLVRLQLFNTRPYASVIEQGSGPHLIRVRRAKVLYSSRTAEFFGPLVHHPGTRPQHVIRDTLLLIAAGHSA